jgi:hypothetical protein
LKPTASDGALRSQTADGDIDELLMSAPQCNASSASLAPSATSEGGGADDESDDGEDWDAEPAAWAAAGGRGRKSVVLSSPRSAPIAVQRPPPAASSTAPRGGSFSAFNWRMRAPDSAADALSGGAFMPPQWRGDTADADGDDASPLSSSLPPLRALALRDCILRRTGFIEKEDSPATSAKD